MMLPENLSPKEIIYLLAVKDKTGRTPAKHEHYHYGVIGSALLELTSMEYIEIENKRLILRKSEPVNDSALNFIFNKINHHKKPRKIKTWVSAFTNHFSKIKKPVRESLYQKGYVEKVEKQFLGLIPYTLHPVNKTKEKQDIEGYLHDIILEKKDYSEKEGAVISMLYLSGIFHTLFPVKKERKQAKNKIKKQIKEGSIASAVGASIKEMQAAMITAVTAATAVTVAAGSSSN